MTCNLQVIFHDNELIPTKKTHNGWWTGLSWAIEKRDPEPLVIFTASIFIQLDNLLISKEREWGFLFVLSFLLLSFTLTLIFLQKLFIPFHLSHTLGYSLLLCISFALYGSDGTVIFIMLHGLRKYENIKSL